MRSAPRRHTLAFLFLVALALPAATNLETTPTTNSLAGQLLVASSDIGDPRFERTVILLLRHQPSGAIGIVINRPIEEQPLASLLRAMGDDATGIEGKALLFAGGPVEPTIGFILHSTDYHRAQTLDVAPSVAVTSSREILNDIAHHAGPEKTLIAFGYSGWGPGQLEGEIEQHAWFTAPADPKLIFDDARDKVWQDAMARRSRPL